MENEMKFQRVMMILLAAMLLPGMALAQTVTRATFEVRKDFSDGNTDATVLVTLNCNTGLPITQSQTIGLSVGDYKDEAVVFVVESFADGELDCSVTEDGEAGYTGEFDTFGTSCGPNHDGEFVDVVNGAVNGCTIINVVDPVEVTVFKNWVIDGAGGNTVDPHYKLVLWCSDAIEGGTNCNDKGTYQGEPYAECGDVNYYEWYRVLTQLGSPNDTWYTADVVPNWQGGTQCFVTEEAYDSSVEVDLGDCGPGAGLDVQLGGAGDLDCTITNTVFFEGIPTLSQYGMAIMALLMLGVGFVGFRRFA
jgi:hypothetical protein